jgi:membrane protein insertase Oxa1/YidC/SpoIIIJ
MKLLQPDFDEMQSAYKRYAKQGNKPAANIERDKMKKIRRTHGIYPLTSLLNLLQLPVHVIYISMINRVSYNFNINPAILTDGMLWFKDLSAPDPYGILPIIGGSISMLNIMTMNSTATS